MSLARDQRAQLLELMQELGALAPTLCEGWQTQDLAAHLWIREHQLAALPGLGIKKFAARTEQLQAAALHRLGFDGLLAGLRRPAGLMRVLDRFVNAAEYTIHHLDVLRANGRDLQLTQAEQNELWLATSMLARRTARDFGGRLILAPVGRPELALGQGNRPVRLSGEIVELLYFLSGRREAAKVELIGEPEALAALTPKPL